MRREKGAYMAAGSFSVTSCTVNKSVIAPTDTVEIKLTIKNVTGSKVVKFGVSFLFTPSDLGISNGWAPGLSPESSVSWANNASKTFTYSVCPDSILSSGYYGSFYNSHVKPRLAELKTLPFRIEMTGVCSDGSGVYDDYNVPGLRYIDMWYRPIITLDAWRYPDDESETLAASMKVELADGANAGLFTATMRYAQDAKATTASPVFEMNVDRDVLFGVGYSANTSVLPGTFSNGSVHSFLLVVTDGYETATAQISVDRAFANMHLSGKSTGGVAFGRFSTATQGSPKLECDYPAYFYGGIASHEYHDGDVVTINGGTFMGYVTGSTKAIHFVIPLRKSLERIRTATLTQLKANISNNGGYAITSASVSGGSNYIVSSVTRSVSVDKVRNVLEVYLYRSTAWDLTNNDALSVRNETISIRLNE